MPDATKLERDVITGSTAAQKIPPGGALANCRDCGAKCLLTSDGIREVGVPAAVVLCDVCASKPSLWDQKTLVDAALGAPGAIPPEGSELEAAIKKLAAAVELPDPRQVTTHFDFDPPSAAAAVQQTMKVLEGGLTATWEWQNDMGLAVLVSRKQKGGQGPDDVMIMPQDKIAFSAMIGTLRHVGAEPPKRKRRKGLDRPSSGGLDGND